MHKSGKPDIVNILLFQQLIKTEIIIKLLSQAHHENKLSHRGYHSFLLLSICQMNSLHFSSEAK